jgi:hypothetical protein
MQGIEIPIGAPLAKLDKDLKGAQKALKQYTTYTDAELRKSSMANYGVQKKQLQISESLAEGAAKAAKAIRVQAVETQAATAASGGFVQEIGGAYSSLKGLANILPGIGIAGIFTLGFQALKPLIDQLDLFNKKLSETEKASQIAVDALSSSSYTDAVKNVSELAINIDLANKKLLNKSEVLKQYNETIGKTTGNVKSLDDAEKQLVKNGDAFIQMSLLKAAAQLALGESAKKAFEAEQIRLKKPADVANVFDKAKAGLGQGFFESSEFTPDAAEKYAKRVEVAGTIRRKALASEADKEGKEYQKIAKDFQERAAIISKTMKFDFFPDPQETNQGKSLIDLLKELKEVKLDNYLKNLDISFRLAAQGAEALKKALPKDAKKTFASLTDKPLIGLTELLDAKTFIPDNLGQELYTPFQILQDNIQFDLLPQLGTSFKTFFDDMLMNGKLSFASLGQAIKNTFLSVLASEAAQGVLNLLGSKGGKTEKGGGLLAGIAGVLGIGGKAAPVAKAAPTIASIAATTGGFLGTGAALSGGTAATLASGTAATGGALLPILAGVAAVASIASLFKKKKQAPIPQASSTISTSAAGSAQDFGGGRVVFEISGTNLVGVLNRAGAKLQRFGP